MDDDSRWYLAIILMIGAVIFMLRLEFHLIHMRLERIEIRMDKGQTPSDFSPACTINQKLIEV